MKCSLKWLLLLFVLLICIPVGYAYTVSSVDISPTGDLTPGATVTASFKIQFATSGDETFPAGDTLEMHTDLDNPNWNVVLVINDVDNVQPVDNVKTIDISGWILSYKPSDYTESMRVTLTGSVPSVTSTTTKTIVKVSQLDSSGAVESGSEVNASRQVVNQGDVTAAISAQQSALDDFRVAIDEKYSLGVDTTAAEQKYSEAQSAIASAKAQPATGYSAAMASLATAQQAIADGGTTLDKAWAQKAVSDAQVPITQTDALITWLTPNATSSDLKAQLSQISTAQDIASGYINDANDAIDAGTYDKARQKADAAFQKANQSYTTALAMKKSMLSGFNPLAAVGGLFKGSTLMIVVIILVIVGAVGFVIYRRRTQWDELG